MPRLIRTWTVPPWTFTENVANLVRLFLAICWTSAWLTARCIRHPRWSTKWNALWNCRVSPRPYRCTDCGWAGPLRWATHTYERAGDDDISGVSLCPRCGTDALTQFRWSKKLAWWPLAVAVGWFGRDGVR